uniref:Uncharacterized protein n=1 Tax=Anguilla anguilla TaxID=7936 RepID=A0A0E9P9A2_ANGAN
MFTVANSCFVAMVITVCPCRGA